MKSKEISINPVTIIGTDVHDDIRDLNDTFVATYDSKIVTDILNYKILKNSYIEAVKSGYKEPFMDWVGALARANNIVIRDVVTGYMVSNITEITYTSIMNYIVNMHDKINKPIPNNDVFYSYMQNCKYEEIMDIVIRVVTSLPIALAGGLQENYAMFNCMMDGILAHIMTEVVEVFINRTITMLYETRSIDAVYRHLYAENYNNGNKTDIEIPQPNICYTFVAGCFREAFNDELNNLRIGLSHIAGSAAKMVQYSLLVGTNIDNDQHTLKDFINESPYASQLCKGVSSIINDKEIESKGSNGNE